MGGVTPLGYAAKDRKLIVVPEEAATVRLIFERYRELGSVRLLKQDLDRRGIRSKQRTYRNGARVGGQPFSRGSLYALLSNPIYVGEIAHKGVRHPGQHEAILDRETWDMVQQQLCRTYDRRRATTAIISPLAGKVFDAEGERLTPSHAVKPGRRYRYYVSRSLITGARAGSPQGWRIPAALLERLVAREAAALLSDKGAIAAAVEQASLPARELRAVFAGADRYCKQLVSQQGAGTALAALIERVELGTDRLHLSLLLAVEGSDPRADAVRLVRDIPLCIERRGVEMRLVLGTGSGPGKPDRVLLKELCRAHRCFDALVTGRVPSIGRLAEIEALSDRYVSRLLSVALLAPDIVETIVSGNQPAELTAYQLIREIELPIAWPAQRQLLGFG
ncbi:MAG: recombinase family protein [Alphaproteobacteria bacterium]|nr:recombinase family protein [Alphaproteobacteria bacterium]MBV9862760.1 recombinase family protein [Alphaproteobacteria bacterium]